MRGDACEIELCLGGDAAGARVVEFLRAETGLQLLDVVDRAADAASHTEAVVAPVVALERIHAVLEVLRDRSVGRVGKRLTGVFGASGAEPAARAELEVVGGGNFGEHAPGYGAVNATHVVVDEGRHAVSFRVTATDTHLDPFARPRRVAEQLLGVVAAVSGARAHAALLGAAREQLHH